MYMKKQLLTIITSCLMFVGINQANASYYFQVTSINSFTGGAAYSLNAAASPLALSLAQCSGGGSNPKNSTIYNLSWYRNTVNSTSGGTLVQSTVESTALAFGDLKNYTPSTATTGTFYYYAVLSSPSYTTCGFTGNLTSTTQQVIVSSPGAALNFDGVDDYVNVGNSINSVLNTKNKITIESWVYPTSTSGLGPIAGNYNTSNGNNSQMQFLLRRDNDTYTFWVDDGSGFKNVQSPASTVVVNTWQHVAGVWDGSALTIYVNGVLKGTTTGVTGATFLNTTNQLWIGADNIGEDYAGSIDEVRVWDIARTQCQINTSMNCELANSDRAGLLLYNKFNQGTAGGNNSTVTTAADSSGNAYTGTLTNMALTGATSNWISPGGVTTGVTCGPVVNPTVTVNSPSVLIGNTATLTASGATSYTWSTSATTASITPSPTVTTDYTVTGADANYCMGSATGTVTVLYPGAALNFDGVNDYVSSNNPISHGNQFTYEAWINTTSPNDWGGIMATSSTSGQAQWVQFTLTNSGRLKVEVVDDASNNKWYEGTTTLINDGNWHHVAVTYDGNNNLVLYVDGIIQALFKQNDQTLGSITINSTLYVGAERSLGPRYYGSIDEARIWTRALCQGEIQNSMNAELHLPQTGLLVYYRFNEGIDNYANPTVTILSDSSGNGYDGTLTNFALTGTTSNWVAPGAVTTGSYSPSFVPPTITVNSPAICVGSTATLTASGVSTYTWSTTETTASISPSPTVTTNYTVTGADANYCMASATSTVTVNSVPVISSQSGSVNVCGDNVNKSFTVSSAGSNTYQWYWNSGAGSLIPSGGTANIGSYGETNYTTNNMTILVTQSDWGPTGTQGVYCVVTNTNNCTATTAFDTIFFNPLPTIGITVTSATVCAGVADTLTASGGVTYLWNTTSATTVSVTVTSTVTTQYTVTGTDANGCVNTGTVSVIVNTCGLGINNVAGNNALNIYPNPSNGNFEIRTTAQAKAIMVTDMLGNILLSVVPNGTNTNVQLSTQPNGFYLIKVIDADGSQTVKRITINN